MHDGLQTVETGGVKDEYVKRFMSTWALCTYSLPSLSSEVGAILHAVDTTCFAF